MTPVVVMALLGFAAVLAARRRDALVVRFTPDRHTWTAIATCVAVAAASPSILLVGPGSSAARAIHVLVIYALLGCAVPWGYALFVEWRAGLGRAAPGLDAGAGDQPGDGCAARARDRVRPVPRAGERPGSCRGELHVACGRPLRALPLLRVHSPAPRARVQSDPGDLRDGSALQSVAHRYRAAAPATPGAGCCSYSSSACSISRSSA